MSSTYECQVCEKEAEVTGITDHWLQLYCENCDREFERAASKDMDGVSVGDLRQLSEYGD